jgi:hypothetical protein
VATSPANRWKLLLLKRRILNELRELEAVGAELHEVNADQFMHPVAADDQPWILGIEPTRRELVDCLAQVDAMLIYRE